MKDEKIIECPNCGNINMNTKVENGVNHHTCIMCGYYTQDDYKIDIIDKFKPFLPRLYQDLCLIDSKAENFWLPIVIDYPNLALLFPDGTSKDTWDWCIVPYEVIPKEERPKYPIQGKANSYHTHRISMKHAKHFEKNSFIAAMSYLNFLLKDVN